MIYEPRYLIDDIYASLGGKPRVWLIPNIKPVLISVILENTTRTTCFFLSGSIFMLSLLLRTRRSARYIPPLESNNGIPQNQRHPSVMRLLGHRNINNTLIYTRLIDFKEDDYIARIAHSEQEVCQLIESGFEYICDFKGNKIFRKRK